MDASNKLVDRVKPYVAVVFLNAAYAGLDIISKAAMNGGMNVYVYVTYANAVATVIVTPFAAILDKRVRPKMTSSVFMKIFLLSALHSLTGMNLYFNGMKYTTATFASAMGNTLPAIAFLLALIFRLEKVSIKEIRSQATAMGTILSVAGTTVMTLVEGPVIWLPWTEEKTQNSVVPQAHGSRIVDSTSHSHTIMGSLLISVSYVSWASFIILQSVVVKEYPAELSLSTWICVLSTIECAAITLVMQKPTGIIWSIHWDIKLIAALYNGIICTGLGYYALAVALKARGPVFFTAFSPLSSVVVAIAGSFILHEKMYMGRAIGAVIVIIGLYLVLWGKSKDREPSSSSSPSEDCEQGK